MAKNKPAENKSMAEWLQGVAEPNRIAILKALSTGSKNVTELAKLLNVEIVNVSHHLGVLRQGGIVTDEKHGRFVVYSLPADKIEVKANTLILKHADGALEIKLN